MNRKIKLLHDKIYYNFITGLYGPPKIPDERDILRIVHSITKEDNEPITRGLKLDDIFIDDIRSNFNSIIDDIQLLYDSIEDQSTDISNQLTNSLKEHNGVKRELRNIDSKASDIRSGKIGKDYLKYVFTEDFNNLDNIDVTRTTTDMTTKSPIVDIKSGSLYIPNSLIRLVDISHYYGRKLDIINTDYQGYIVDEGFEGHSNAAAIIDINDPKRLVYRVKTSLPTALNSSFVIQLNSQRNPVKINGIAMSIDSEDTGGLLNIQYKDNAQWKSIPDIPFNELSQDKLVFRFESIETTHLKFRFIKESPDLLDSNEYFIVIDNLSIVEADTYKRATMYSKSIKISPYDTEKVVIGNLGVEAQGYIPDGCSVDVSVANDKLVKGYFEDENDNYVSSNSIHIDHFVSDSSSTYPERHILLSDIKNNPEADNISSYNSVTHDWKIVKSFNNTDYQPGIINFAKMNIKDPFDNTIYQERLIKFGDDAYYSAYGTYPQPGQSLDPWFLSGVIDTSNPFYSYMDGYIDSGLLISGLNYETPTGYPVNYYNSSLERRWVFGDKHSVLDGWWRPDSILVTPTGLISTDVLDVDPDFYFNGIKFYKIYKLSSTSRPVESSLKLYMYQTKPAFGPQYLTGEAQDYYPHNLIWNYNSRDIIGTAEYNTTTSSNYTHQFPGSGAFSLPLSSGQILIENSVRDVHYMGHNNILEEDIHYDLVNDWNNSRWIMDLNPCVSTTSYLASQHIHVKYSYKYQDAYTSYWDGYILASSQGKIKIKQSLYKNKPVVDRVDISTLNGKTVHSDILSEENVVISLEKDTYKIRIFCLSDDNTKYAANEWSPYSRSFIETDTDMKLVPKVLPIKMIDFDILLHSTPYENDNRASIITSHDGSRYVVIKEPSKNILQGYYYNGYYSSYMKDSNHLIRNIGHYKRQFMDPTSASGYLLKEYITGSSGNLIVSGIYGYDTPYTQDLAWNRGHLYPVDFENYDNDKLFTQRYTFGNPIDLEDTPSNKGHLFYNTAENLPEFYTIEYGIVNEYDPTLDRFLYKVQLNSEHETNTPVVDSIKFTINKEES